MIPLLALMSFHVGADPLQGEVTLAVAHRHIDVTLDMQLPSAGPAHLVSYLDVLRVPYVPGDVDRLWDTPRGPNSSQAQWGAVLVDGIAVDPSEPLPPGKRLHARLYANIPERYGGLGFVDGDVMLAAAVPFIVVGEPGTAHARAQRVAWTLHHAPLERGQWLFHSDHFEGDPSLFVTGVARHGYVTLDGEPKSPIVRPFGSKVPRWSYFGTSADAQLLSAHAWIAKALAALGVPAQKWVVHALRREPAVCGEDTLIVSRELFRVTPLPQLITFQRFGLARRAIACALRHAWQLDAEDADMLAAAEVDALFVGETMKRPRDLLRPLSFIPDIDSLIYAPQMPWADVYFMAVDEPRVGPAEPDTFFHSRARGKLLFAKLWDRLGAQTTRALVTEALARHVGLSVVAHERAPAAWDAIVTDFSARHPVFNAFYTQHGTTVTVIKEGPGALSREPITVKVVDPSGKVSERTAENFQATDPEHAQADVNFAEVKEIASVEIDPERRLVEYLLKPGEHPRYDNSTNHRVRLTLSRLSASYGTSASELFAGVDFNVRREYDLHHHFGFGADYDPLSAGVSGRYAYAFGPRVTPDYLAYRVGTSLTLERLTQGFVGATQPVYQGTAYAYINHDDRPSDRTAMRGFGWQVFGAVGVPIGRPAYGYAGASVLKILPLADGHGLAGRLRIGTVIGTAPAQALFPLGGRSNARGFPQTEATGAARITANIEYRHVLFRGFRASLFDLVFIDAVEGALFGDAVLLSNDWRKIFMSESAFFDVGYGIRFLYDQLGVNPGMISVDVGVPLKRVDASRAPVSVYIDFVQSFAGL